MTGLSFSPALPLASIALPLLRAAAIGAYALLQALLLVYAGHRWVTLWRARRATGEPWRKLPAAPETWPVVTVQIPLYNERRVAARLIDAVAALDYPRDRLEIQVLDDSTDETRERVAAAVTRARAAGVDIHHLRRGRREGFKAGALAEGLTRARGELLAIFDADFVPRPDFLRRMVPSFADPAVGLVQARWGHLNRSRSMLTTAQAVLLDAHFLLEHEARMRGGLFFNFNGTAGVWRRACVIEAGGWSSQTLTEDLDLSYRAQLAGWRFVFRPDVVVPAELPGDMESFKSQQRRWVRGSIQTGRKLLARVWRSPLPRPVQLEATFHLTANACYPMLVALSLLILPVQLAFPAPAAASLWLCQAVVLLAGFVPSVWFLAEGQRRQGVPLRALPGPVAAALIVSVGISINNALAVLRGLGTSPGDWERTPKTGEADRIRLRRAYPAPRRNAGRAELALALYFSGVLVWTARAGRPDAWPYLALLIAGLIWVGEGSWRAARARASAD